MSLAVAVTEVRLDRFVMERHGVSRTVAQELIEAGRVSVNARPGRPGRRVRAGDDVRVEMPPAPQTRRDDAGPAVPLRAVYEDDWLMVIDKPAGLVVHPAAGHPHGTLVDGLRQRGEVWSTLGGRERPGIVHRLDRPTSGLLVVARSDLAHRRLAAQLADRTLGRDYWALAWGGFHEESATIEAPLGRDPRHRKRFAVVDGGRAARTELRVVERLPRLTVLDVSLSTGRTHQIRVHLASIGHPVAGDPVYGRHDDPLGGRLALHARRLRLRHPGDGAERVFESPLPDELRAVLERAGELRA